MNPSAMNQSDSFPPPQRLEPERSLPASPLRAVATWTLTGLLLALAFFLQRPPATDPTVQAELVSGLRVQPVDPTMRLLGKIAIAGGGALSTPPSSPPGFPSNTGTPFGQSVQPMLDQAVGFDLENPPTMFGPPPGPNDPITIKHKDAGSAADRFRVAMLSGETLGPNAAVIRLDALKPLVDPASEIADDIRLMRAHFERQIAQSGEQPPAGQPTDDPPEPAEPTEASDEPAPIDAATADDLVDRHGLFAAAPLHDISDEAKRVWDEATADGTRILIAMAVLGLLVLAVLFAGFVLCIVALIGAIQGWLCFRFRSWIRPFELSEPDRLVWVETVAVFLFMFLGFKLLLGALVAATNMSDEQATIAALLGQWLVLPAIFWPLVRGVSWDRWKQHLGWTARQPAGEQSHPAIVELALGVAGHVAWLFIYVCFAMVWVLGYSMVSNALGARPPGGLEENRMTDLFGGSGLAILLVVPLASIWAPVVEESIFRGVLFRHWRPRLGFFGAAFGSAILFAALHGYHPMQLVLVGMLGMGFAVIREWRGTILGCAAAHATHNFLVTIVMAVLIGWLA